MKQSYKLLFIIIFIMQFKFKYLWQEITWKNNNIYHINICYLKCIFFITPCFSLDIYFFTTLLILFHTPYKFVLVIHYYCQYLFIFFYLSDGNSYLGPLIFTRFSKSHLHIYIFLNKHTNIWKSNDLKWVTFQSSCRNCLFYGFNVRT